MSSRQADVATTTATGRRGEGPALRGAAALFAALGDETRLTLVSRLSIGGPLSISRLTAGVEVSRQAVTKHLDVLSDAGLVRGARRGREKVWQLHPGALQD